MKPSAHGSMIDTVDDTVLAQEEWKVSGADKIP